MKYICKAFLLFTLSSLALVTNAQTYLQQSWGGTGRRHVLRLNYRRVSGGTIRWKREQTGESRGTATVGSTSATRCGSIIQNNWSADLVISTIRQPKLPSGYTTKVECNPKAPNKGPFLFKTYDGKCGAKLVETLRQSLFDPIREQSTTRNSGLRGRDRARHTTFCRQLLHRCEPATG